MTEIKTESCTVDNDYPRLDVFLRRRYPQYSREFFRRLIRDGYVTVEDKPAKSSLRVKKGETIALTFPDQPALELLPEDLPLSVIYEDEQLIVLNKQPGMVIHPACGHRSGTLVNALLGYFQKKYPEKDVRPYLVHRLDKDTSGVLVVAKNDLCKQKISLQFEKRQVEKVYLALVKGVIQEEEGLIDAALGRSTIDRRRMTVVEGAGRSAQTRFKVKKRFPHSTYLELYPKTGRTHQLRVHCIYIGHPILGDKDYGEKTLDVSRPMLHAYSIKFFHPEQAQTMKFTAPLPKDFLKTMKTLGK
ncbi:MAG: RluA family pseudouridine synthase [Elusimicrobiota bacterium]